MGGIENHMKTLAEAQVAAGHQVRVLVTNPDNQRRREQINGVVDERFSHQPDMLGSFRTT